MAIRINIGRLHWIHWAIITLSLVLTVAAWYISSTQIEQKTKQRFEYQSSQLLEKITERMNHYEDALRTGVVSIHTNKEMIDVESWRRFSEAVRIGSLYPGINGIGVIFHVPGEKYNKFIEQQRKQRPNFKIHPDNGLEENWPITYLEPTEGNELAVGLDISFEQNRLSAAMSARDSATTHITEPIVLVQDAKKSPGIIQYLPFYSSHEINTVEQRRKYFVGHVYAPFIMSKLIDGTLGQDKRSVIFNIHDGKQILYDELNENNPNYRHDPLYQKNINIKMYNRIWNFTIQTSNFFEEDINTQRSTYILITGVIIDALLLILFVVLSGNNKKSLLLVDSLEKKVDLSEEYFKQVIEAAPCGIIITSDAGIIERINPQAESLFGYTMEEMIGQSIDMLVPDRYRHGHAKHRDHFYKNQSRRRMGLDRKVFGLKKNGDEFPAEIGLAHFTGDEGVKILSTVIDMTEHALITNELQRSNKDLNDFAYIASHDLKAPLRGIMQLSSWVEEDISATASEETKGYLTLLKSRTARLEKLLDDLLTYSRVGRQNLEKSDVDMNVLVESLYQLQDPPEGFVLNIIDDLPVFNTLSIPLEVVFRNLLGNAIKHHDKTSGIVTVSFTENDGMYSFTVTNDGPGIAAEHQEQIFEMFKTLRSRDEVEGSGMGLAIIKKIIEYHGGDISVSSDGNRGVSFTFTWPQKI